MSCRACPAVAQVDTGSWSGTDSGGAGPSGMGDDSSMYTFVGSDGGLSLPDGGAHLTLMPCPACPAHDVTSPAGGPTGSDATTGPEYLRAGLDKGVLSFSLQAVVEISRLNAFRMSSIWQMVTSHLRMLASLKASTTS